MICVYKMTYELKESELNFPSSNTECPLIKEEQNETLQDSCIKIEVPWSDDEISIDSKQIEDYKNTNEFSFIYKIYDPYLRGLPNFDPKNFVRNQSYEDLNLTEEEMEGVLTDRIITTCALNLEMSAVPGKNVLANCDLSRKALKNIGVIKYHQFLRYLDLSRNFLTSLEALGSLHFLTNLDASHNLLSGLLDFKAPLHLTKADFSYNLIENIEDLSDFWTLVYLDVSHNLITEINGLKNLRYLNYLNLSYNQIKTLKNLENLRVEILLLNNNEIQDYEMGFQDLFNLRYLDISLNKLVSLKVFENSCKLECVKIAGNQIRDLVELEYFSGHRFLNNVDLRDNPICVNQKYTRVCIKVIKNLGLLDGKEIDSEEAGFVRFIFEHSLEKEVGYNNVAIKILENLKIPEINSTVVPGYQNTVPLIILVGPFGSRKNKFVTKICEIYSKFVVRGVSYTTRPRCSHEEDGVHYYFVTDDDFKKLIDKGELMCCSQKYGYYFGIGLKEIQKITENFGILIFQCDFFSALQVKTKFPNSSLIFTVFKSENLHKKWLLQKFYFHPWISRHVRGYILRYLETREAQVYSEEEKKFFQSYLDEITRDAENNKFKNSGDLQSQETQSYRDSIEKAFQLVPILKAAKTSSSNQPQRVSFSVVVDSALIPVEELNSASEMQKSIPDLPINSLLPSISKNLAEIIGSEGFILSSLSASQMKNLSGKLIKKSSTDLKEMSFQNENLGFSSFQTLMESEDELFQFCESDDTFEFNDWFILKTIPNESENQFLASISEALLEESQHGFILTAISKTNKDENNIFEKPSRSESFQFKCPSENFEEYSTQSSIEFMLCNASHLDLGDNVAKLCMEYFLKNEMKKRNIYLDMYRKYPGLFVTSIYPEEEAESLKRIKLVVKNCVEAQRKYCEEKQLSHTDLIDRDMRKAKIDLLHDLLK